MTRLERMRDRLKGLEERRSRLLRSGRYPQSRELDSEIKRLEAEIRKSEEYELLGKPGPLRELLTKEEINEMGIIPLMIECHLVADFLTEIAYEVVDICKAHGLSDISLMPKLRELIKNSELFASFLTKLSPELCDLLVRNETFNAGLHKRYLKYIGERIK